MSREWKNTEVGVIPVDWEVNQIQEIGDVVGGGTPKTTIEDYWNGDISWITPKDLSNHSGRYVFKGERSITKRGLDNSSAKIIPKGTILFSSRAPIGYLAIAGKDMCTNQGFKSIVCNEKKANNIFLYYLMMIKRYELENIAGGSTFKEVSGKIVKEFKIQVPPLEEQKAIANILSTLDEKIEANNQINKKLEEMAQTIFKHWFIDFEFPNENGEPYKSSGGEMIESELGMIPKGWEVGILSNLIEITSGKRPAKKSESKDESFIFPLIGASSIMGYSEDYNFNEQVLVIGRVGTHGVVQRFNRKIWASDNTLIIKSKAYEYIYQILNAIDYSALNRGSTQPLITQTDIKNYSVLIPVSEILEKYEKLIGSIFFLHSNKCDENEKLNYLRDTLLPKLMSGEIRVPIDN
ncbi:type I restriction enzyme, S subunit [Proteiniborus ethanoligenes]|uniref:Type I restriction enzyme, S subunit n=1 Tax=Proteiniborus ethanoligenes TaxID=415015 RepID=A0A1H3MJ34_9FIRM|nr:restriction endonuclease subunit S [Proteiniborus ethanoligenes]SDY76408.1 type I restriction enzyme, S subunit [Proteiniborus ethanoligenes]